MNRSKYGNRRTEVDGIVFDSAAEARRYRELRLLEQAGAIGPIQLQPRFPLVVEGVKIGTYVGDFAYDERGRRIVEDVKGGKATMTPVWRLKVKLVSALYGFDVVVVNT